jgi:hypothetical protein
MSACRTVLLICLGSVPVACAVAQATPTFKSTSPWQKIGAPTAGLSAAPAVGEGYMTVTVRKAAAWQNSNWWTNFVERNRNAVLTANLTATIANIPVSQTATGKPIDLVKNKSMADLGYSGLLVDHLPLTFSGMNVNLQINKTAQDGLASLITEVSQLSTSQPPVLAISSQAMAITSFAKNVADFLFHADLIVGLAGTTNPFSASDAIDPGIYVCFAGDQESDYNNFLSHPDQLKWDGANLTFSGNAVSGVSYFVIEVNYESTFFAKPIDALNFGASKPWVVLIKTAEGEIPGVTSATQAANVENDIESHLANAYTLLYQDYSFIDSERDQIYKAAHDKLTDEFQQRMKDLGIPLTGAGGNTPNPPGAAPAPGAGPAPAPTQPAASPALRPVLAIEDPVLIREHNALIRSQGLGTVIVPTSGR